MVSEMRKTPPALPLPVALFALLALFARPPTCYSLRHDPGGKPLFLRDSVQYSPRMTKQSRPTESQPVNRGHHDCCQ